jgi:hypothetical protein
VPENPSNGKLVRLAALLGPALTETAEDRQARGNRANLPREVVGVIIDFPSIKTVTETVEVSEGYTVHRWVIVRSFWIRIIWSPEQKTIIIGKWRIHFTYEPGASEHLEQVLSKTEPEWYER